VRRWYKGADKSGFHTEVVAKARRYPEERKGDCSRETLSYAGENRAFLRRRDSAVLSGHRGGSVHERETKK